MSNVPLPQAMTAFGQAVKKYMGARQMPAGQSAGQSAEEASQMAGPDTHAAPVDEGAYGTPPPFGGGPPSLSDPTPPQGGP
jgi:hypothetical protein